MVFIGIVNDPEYLRDPTGSSRFHTLPLSSQIDMETINKALGYAWNGSRTTLEKPELLKQFWLEIKALYETGYGWVLSNEESKKSLEINEGYNAALPFSDLIENKLRNDVNDAFYTSLEIGYNIGIDTTNPRTMATLRRTLTHKYGRSVVRKINQTPVRGYLMPTIIGFKDL